jgi:hypothetical protein
LSFPFQEVRFAGPVDEVIIESVPPGNPTTIPRQPLTATVNARMVVHVVVEIATANQRTDPRVITTEATYELRGGIASDEANPGTMVFTDLGDWVLVGYEILDA